MYVFRAPTSARIVSFIVLLTLTVIGVTPAQGQEPLQTPPRETVRIAMPEPASLDPATLSRFDPYARDLVENLFVGLMRYDPLRSEIEPALARSWHVSDDSLVWTFELRDDVYWVRFDQQKGEMVQMRQVTSGDFVYAVQRACNPTRPSPVTSNLMVIKGCLKVADTFPEMIDDVFVAREIGVRAVAPHTLEIELAFPVSFLPALLSTPEFRPLPREIITDQGSNWTTRDTFMTNGPFALQAWSDAGMTIVRNPFWPDSTEGNVQQVEVVFLDAPADGISLFAEERVDLIRLSDDAIADAMQEIPESVQVREGKSVTVLGFSYERAVVDKADARRALATAIDRTALIEQVFADQVKPVNQVTPSFVIASPSNTIPAGYAPGEARQFLAEAGFSGCNNMPEPLTIYVPDDDPRWMEVASTLTQQWSSVLGCNSGLFVINAVSRAWLIELAHANYDQEAVERPHIWMATWREDYSDANAWLYDSLHCRYGYLRTTRECDEADALLDRASVEMDITTRAELYAQVENHFWGTEGTFPAIPLWRNLSAWLQAPHLAKVDLVESARFDQWVVNG